MFLSWHQTITMINQTENDKLIQNGVFHVALGTKMVKHHLLLLPIGLEVCLSLSVSVVWLSGSELRSVNNIT